MHVFHVLFSVNSCTAVDTSDTAWRQEILGLSKGRLGLRSLYQLAPAAYIASICSAGQRQIFTSVLQLQILILLFHLTRHCKFTPFSQRLWSPKKNYQVEAGNDPTADHSHTHPADLLLTNWTTGKTASCL